MNQSNDPNTGHSTLGGDYEEPRGHIRLRRRPWLRSLIIGLVIVVALLPVIFMFFPW